MNEGTRNLGESIRWPIIICLPHTPPSPAPPAAASDAAASDAAAAAATAAQKGRHMPSLDAVSIILRGGGERWPPTGLDAEGNARWGFLLLVRLVMLRRRKNRKRKRKGSRGRTRS